MAKRSNTSRTTRTTTTRSGRGPTTRTTKTTTTRINNRPAAKTRIIREPPPKAKSHWGTAIAILLILILLILAAYLFTSVSIPLSQQKSQFSSQLAGMQNNNQNLTLFYLSNAANYKLNVNQSWSVQATDQDSNGSIVGQTTISWNGQSKSLSVQDGIVDTGISPTYAVTLSHSQFMSLSQDIITRNTAAAFAYYTGYYLTGKIKYTRVS